VKTEAKKRAEEAARRAAAGEDFAALAKQFSQDPTAARGGDIGLIPRGVRFKAFEDVAFAAKPGAVSGVFETPDGYNVVKVLEKHPVSVQSFDEVKSQLMLEMGRMMEQDLVRAKVKDMAATANIAILDPTYLMPNQAARAAAKP
jgi:parvulin-like peptidyl-prolyl isomerase